MYRYSVPCLMGVEGLVADELKFGGFEGVEAENGRVTFFGDALEGARANVQLRCGERVLILLGEFDAHTFDDLFEGVKALPWEEFVGVDDAFPVKGYSIKSKLHSVPACQKIVKKAAVERLRSAFGGAQLAETGPRRQIQFALSGDRAAVYIDTSGAPLYKRGYKTEQNMATIRETLAAAMVKIARYRGREEFIDPMCGSGTIAIEAATAALGLAPGRSREFDAALWGGKWAEAFGRAQAQAQEQAAAALAERGGQPLPITAMDIDPECVALTKANVKRAGLAGMIKVIQGDATGYDYPQKGTLISNPPYGERLMDIERARELYRAMGVVLAGRPGLKKYIISSDDSFQQCFGTKADKLRKLYNGMIKCNLHMYYK